MLSVNDRIQLRNKTFLALNPCEKDPAASIELRKKKRNENITKRREQSQKRPLKNLELLIRAELKSNYPGLFEINSSSESKLELLSQSFRNCNTSDLPYLAESLRKCTSSYYIVPEVLLQENISEKLLACIESTDEVLRYEAVWIVINLTYASEKQATMIAEAGVARALCELVKNNWEVTEFCSEALWAISHMVVNEYQYRDQVFLCGLFDFIVEKIQCKNIICTELLEAASMFLSNLFRPKPFPSQVYIKKYLAISSKLLGIENKEILKCTIWGLCNIMLDEKNIKQVVDTGVAARIFTLFSYNSEEITNATLRFFGSMLYGGPNEVQVAVGLGVIEKLHGLAINGTTIQIKETLWSFSNLAAASKTASELLFLHGVFDTILKNLSHSVLDLQIEGFYALKSVLLGCNHDLVLSKSEILLEKIISALKVQDSRILILALKCLEIILDCGKRAFITSQEAYEDLLLQIDRHNGISIMESLQKHPNDQIYDQVQALFLGYFNCIEETPSQADYKFS